MDTLLTNDFIAQYSLTAPTAVAPFKETEAAYFELKDDATIIYLNANDGIAPHKNNSLHKVKVINYETFHTGLPQSFRHGKKICDLILYTTSVKNYFSLNELTDTFPPKVEPNTDLGGKLWPGKRDKALQQLNNTLSLLVNVPNIKSFMDGFMTKRCCFFNKQTTPVPIVASGTITAPTSFGRINTLTEEGFQMSHPSIEALGFQLFEYSGGKAAVIN